AHDPCILPPQEREPLRLEGEQLVQAIEAALMECEILLEHGQLLRNVADPALERSNPAGDIRDLSRQSSFLRACCRESGLNISELAAVVTGGRSGEHEPGNNGNSQSAGHKRKVRRSLGRPCRSGRSAARTSFLGSQWAGLRE